MIFYFVLEKVTNHVQFFLILERIFCRILINILFSTMQVSETNCYKSLIEINFVYR